jgi:DNA-binding NarL/FixJ family response regulator
MQCPPGRAAEECVLEQQRAGAVMSSATFPELPCMAPGLSPAQRGGAQAAKAERPCVAVVDQDASWFRIVRALRLTRQLPRLRIYNTAAALLDEAQHALPVPWHAALVSIGLPDLHGVVLVRELRRRFPGLRLVVALPLEEPHTLLTAICAGADGYVLKDRTPRELVTAFELLLGGCPVFGAPLAECLLGLIGDLSRNAAALRALSPRLGFSFDEYRFLQLLAYGESPAVAAQRLQLGAGSAGNAMRIVYRRLQTPLLAAVVPAALRASFARRHGGAAPIEIPPR